MTNEEQVRRIKEIAAQKAFEAYAETVSKLLFEAQLPVIESLHDTTHIHSALLVGEKKEILAVKCRWDFTADPDVIAKGLEAVRKEGRS